MKLGEALQLRQRVGRGRGGRRSGDGLLHLLGGDGACGRLVDGCLLSLRLGCRQLLFLGFGCALVGGHRTRDRGSRTCHHSGARGGTEQGRGTLAS